LAILTSAYAIALVALGLGFVIFIHELGHFLLAKWNDVKVEKFSIGFGPTVFGFRRGETEYVLAAVPLGGFVKMLGEGPEDEQNKSTDPRSYPNKSVGARMAIISAGVIMNVLLGLVCFVYSFGRGMDVIPANIGAVAPASPAYRAGLRPGDEIVSIDGREDTRYTSLQLKVALSRRDQVLHFVVRRPGRDRPIELDIRPVREPSNDRPTIGILPAEGREVGAFRRPAGMADAPPYPGLDRLESDDFVDTLAAAGPADREPTPIATAEDYHRILAANVDRPIRHVIERRSGSAAEDGPVLEHPELILPPARFVDFGLRMAIEPISAIQAGSPAEQAGFRLGDLIVKVDGRDFDPMRLPGICYRGAGQPMTFEVERAAADGGRRTQTITATPDATALWTEPRLGRDLDVPSLGLCYPVSSRVAAVTPDSPAARADIRPGNVINAMIIKPSKPAKSSGGKAAAGRAETLKFEEGASSWVVAFGYIQGKPDADIELVVNKATQPVAIKPEVIDRDWYYPSRGLMFMQLRRKLAPQPIGPALRLGYEDTIENIMSIYAMFRSLFTGQIGYNNLGGFIPISRAAFSLARMGLTYLIHFLGILSINLAVLNFLPIPPLDGGQMVFLVAEKIRGRPLPESVLVAGTYLGLLLVLGVMIVINVKDIFQLF
jgi:regulator of sigma E protease